MPYACDECSFICDEEELNPMGDCPECGGWVSPVESTADDEAEHDFQVSMDETETCRHCGADFTGAELLEADYHCPACGEQLL